MQYSLLYFFLILGKSIVFQIIFICILLIASLYMCACIRRERVNNWFACVYKNCATCVDYPGGAKSGQAELGTPDGRVARAAHCRGHGESCHLEARPCRRGSQEASRARGEKVPIVLLLFFFPS